MVKLIRIIGKTKSDIYFVDRGILKISPILPEKSGGWVLEN